MQAYRAPWAGNMAFQVTTQTAATALTNIPILQPEQQWTLGFMSFGFNDPTLWFLKLKKHKITDEANDT